MKQVAIIDVCNYGSTGKIANNLQTGLKERGYQSHFYYGRGRKSAVSNQTRIKPYIGVYIHAGMARITGLQGFFSILSTLWLIHKLKRGKYDTVILISTHSYFLNEKIFFTYIADQNLRFINIMPDAYPYLGNCTACEPQCGKYITGEGCCPNVRKYPPSLLFDTCGVHLRNKIHNYSKLKRAKFVAPEYVIRDLKKSLVGQEMQTEILDESIDLTLYQPRESSSLRCKLGIPKEKIVLLCVAPPYKNASLFIEAAEILEKDNRFYFIYIGKLDCPLADNLTHITYVERDIDLAGFYSLADAFVFTSTVDTMANACLEALACGTPLIVFNTSGMPYLMDETVGTLVPPYDVDALVRSIAETKKKDARISETCRKYALARFDGREYVDKLVRIAETV